MLGPVTRQTLADQVVERLIEAIVMGEVATGSPISENEVAIRFGVSRGPAREAIFRLEGKGLVTRAPHVGAQVVDLTLEDLRALFEMREALEGMACGLAALRIEETALRRLEATIAQHAEQPEVASGQSYYQPGGERDFHVGIAAASGNARLIRMLACDVYDVMRVYRYRSALTPGRAVAALEEHRAILAALRARDPAGAEQAMRAHIRASWENTRQTFRSGPDLPRKETM